MEKLIVFAASAVCGVFITALVCLLLYWAADFFRMCLDRPGSMPQAVWGMLAVIVFAVSVLILQRYGFRAYDRVEQLVRSLPIPGR